MQVTQLPAHTLHHVNRNGIQNRRRAQPQKITRSVSGSPSFFFDFKAFGGHEDPHRAPTVITEEPETSLATTSTSCRVYAYERAEVAEDIASSFAAAAPLRESGRITTYLACSRCIYTLSCHSIIEAGTYILVSFTAGFLWT